MAAFFHITPNINNPQYQRAFLIVLIIRKNTLFWLSIINVHHFIINLRNDIIIFAIAMNVCEPGQDRNVAALSTIFMCGGSLLLWNVMTNI
jgi:hypothetical protein